MFFLFWTLEFCEKRIRPLNPHKAALLVALRPRFPHSFLERSDYFFFFFFYKKCLFVDYYHLHYRKIYS